MYLDDILIFTKTLEEHREVTKEVMTILKDNNLFLKAEKCKFEKEEVEYLGVIISQGRIRMDPVKVNSVLDWPMPKLQKELRQFVGFLNFYHRFIKDFATIAAPLHQLTGKKEGKWGTEQLEVFLALKAAVMTAPVLVMPTDKDEYQVEADSSNYATGAILLQRQNGQWHPIVFMSRSLSDVKRNYDIQNKGLLAIMRSLSEWQHYLMGGQKTFEIWTDHKNLEYFHTARTLNRRQVRWALELAKYDFVLTHKPGKTHGNPDALSRPPDHDKGEEDNTDRVLLRREHFRSMMVDVETEGNETEGNGFDGDSEVVTGILQLMEATLNPPATITVCM